MNSATGKKVGEVGGSLPYRLILMGEPQDGVSHGDCQEPLQFANRVNSSTELCFGMLVATLQHEDCIGRHHRATLSMGLDSGATII